MADTLRPQRARLAEALACVTDWSAERWRAVLERDGGRVDGWRGVGPLVPPATATDPADAWETMASRGLIPAGWIEQETRGFRAEGACTSRCRDLRNAEGEWCEHKHPRGMLYPADVPSCVAIASDAPNIGAVEAIALETARTFYAEPDRSTQLRPTHVVWRVLPLDVARTRLRGHPDAEPGWREILRLGYALDGVDDDAVVLVCPALG